jgi:predicted RNA binding protein YcfA (HicA-like mRNA interferase family)
MPEWPVLSGDEVVRVLERLGFRKVRQKGSHVVMRRGSVGCVVPMHREVKLGTLAGVVRQAQLQPDEFLAALRN